MGSETLLRTNQKQLVSIGVPFRKGKVMKVRLNNIRRRRSLGFSLLELLAVVTILGIIAVVVIPRIAVSSGTARVNAATQTQAEINSALERYFFDYGTYPTGGLATLFATSSPTQPDGTAGQRYFPDGVPVNPFTRAASATDWSYAAGRCTGFNKTLK